ncbi:ABC transporter E member 2 [Salvia divinorum]|uniref:ABC transporter E member 2 n=1 Tax=Salvia divinorum TaxID=28513 RepID=A0ABD1G2Q3_SALDI
MLDQDWTRIASDKDTTHRYGPKSFKLLRLPIPKPGQVLGIVGNNGTGKTTAFRVLYGKKKPNLGRLNNPPDWTEILDHFKGTELQTYFSRIEDLKVMTTLQNVHCIPKYLQGNVGQLLSRVDARGMKQELAAELELIPIMDRELGSLSAGELQRFAIAFAALQNADVYLFDEPSSFLDVKQRLKAAQVIRSLVRPKNYVVVADHDLCVLEYLSDSICCLYGRPGEYGVATLPFSVREGIDIFLAGFLPTENLRFRDEPLKLAETPQENAEEIETRASHKYPTMTMTRGNFRLKVLEGEFTDSQIIVMLGRNGTGKSTFLYMLAGHLKPDSVEGIPKFNVSHKPQIFGTTFQCNVRSMLHSRIRESYTDPQFISDVMKPLLIKKLMDKKLVNLSSGELHKVALTVCLGKPADIYLIDEPSSYLDSEQCIVVSKVIKRFIRRTKKTALVVEHDFIMATYLADRVIVYDGEPSVDCVANSPQSLLTGMNLFLSRLDLTCRRDPTNFLPRFNKLESTEDREQKSAGCHYYLDD